MRLRRSLPWLGWAVAGVLALSVAGTALAASQSDSRTAAALVAQDADKADKQERRLDRSVRLRHFGPFKRAVHGEVTVRQGTDEAGKPQFGRVVFARGEVAELSGDTLRVRSADGVVTSFTLAGDTKLRQRGADVERSALRPGVGVFAVGRKNGEAVTAVRVVLAAPR